MDRVKTNACPGMSIEKAGIKKKIKKKKGTDAKKKKKKKFEN